jgi:hypothetical protein
MTSPEISPLRYPGGKGSPITVCQEDGAALVGRLSRPKVFIYAEEK